MFRGKKIKKEGVKIKTKLENSRNRCGLHGIIHTKKQLLELGRNSAM